MSHAVIVDSIRTGLAKSFRGSFNLTRSDDMVAHLIDALLDRSGESNISVFGESNMSVLSPLRRMTFFGDVVLVASGAAGGGRT